MKLYIAIANFLETSQSGDTMLLSKDGDLENRTGYILARGQSAFTTSWDCEEAARVYPLGSCSRLAEAIAADALFLAHITGRELVSPEHDSIRGLLVARCQCRDMPQDEAKDLLSDILSDLADWLDQRHGGSSQTADLLRAIYP